MAKVKKRNINLLTGEKIILGSNGDHEIYWDGTAIVGVITSADPEGLDQFGTDNASFQIDADNTGPKLIWNGFVLQLKNNTETSDIDFSCRDLFSSQDLLPTRLHRGVQASGSLITGGNLNPTSYLNVAVTTGNETTITSFTTVGAAAGQFCFIRNELAEPITVVPGASIVTPDGNNHTIGPNGSMLIQFRSSYWTVVGTKPDPLIDVNDSTGDITITASHSGQLLVIDSSNSTTIIVPSDSEDNLPIGFNCQVTRKAEFGSVNIVDDGNGVVIRSLNDNTTISGQWGKATLTKIAADEWLLDGDLS